MQILFFGLDYHHYTLSIREEMAALGGCVTWVDVQPRALWHKALNTVQPAAYARYLRHHHAAAIEASAATRYDKVVFLQAHQVSVAALARLRQLQPHAEFTLYNWDSLSNHDYRAQARLFDRVLTFDRADAKAHGWGYLPLFCVRALQDVQRDRIVPRSLFMVGNVVKAGRYRAVEAFRTYCANHGLTFHQHLKITPVAWAKLRREGLSPVGITPFDISTERFRDIVETSEAAFDVANHQQSGQTMRMMESLCAGRRIVTSNQWVRMEPFYTPDRIHIFEGLDFSGVARFMEQPLANPQARFPEYHVDAFTRRLLGLEPVSQP